MRWIYPESEFVYTKIMSSESATSFNWLIEIAGSR